MTFRITGCFDWRSYPAYMVNFSWRRVAYSSLYWYLPLMRVGAFDMSYMADAPCEWGPKEKEGRLKDLGDRRRARALSEIEYNL